MIEFVVREGPMFEAMIMNREMSNPQFRFLFENQSPAHVYYRWKLFTILQGDNPYSWRCEPFRMFKGGSTWGPPRMNPYTQGMPEELVEGDLPVNSKSSSKSSSKKHDSPPPIKRGQLSESQRDRLEDMLRELTPERLKIGDAMVWALDHAESAEEIVECLAESLSILQTPLPKKVARMYLMSDILHNCSAKVPHASYYRKCFETKLPEIFKDIHDYYDKIEGRLKAEQFKQRVMGCFRAWEDWQVYPNEFLIKIQNTFLGLLPSKVEVEEMDVSVVSPRSDLDGAVIDDLDGAPIEVTGPLVKEELDGAPLGLAAESDLDGMPINTSADVDGLPLTEDTTVSQTPTEEKKPLFIKSKWETVDESTLEQQAVTTSKWDMFDQYGGDSSEEDAQNNQDIDGAPMEDLDGAPMEDNSMLSESMDRSRYSEYGSTGTNSRGKQSRDQSPDVIRHQQFDEERRARLREIELKVVKYQDEVEAGKRSRKMEMTLADQVQSYRRKLLNKEEEKERDKMKERDRAKEREKVKEWERAREKEKKREDREIGRSSSRSNRGRDRLSPDNRNSDRRRDRDRRRDKTPELSGGDDLKGSLSMLQRYGGSVSRSPSPDTQNESRSSRYRASPVNIYGRESSDSPTPRKRRKSRSRSPIKKRRSKTPKKSRRSRSITPQKKSKRSRSRSPVKHKHKKHKRKD